jgi:DNA-binding beta-propeller fold protein YncE
MRRVGARRRALAASAALLALATAMTATATAGVAAAPATEPAIATGAVLPRYALDTSWPSLPLPHEWALGLINGIAVDAKNHLWVFHSPEQIPAYIRGAAAVPPTGKCCVPAPAILEFDERGHVLRAWGGPGAGYDWPTSGHGLFVDYKGNVWIGGSQTEPGSDGSLPDGMVLKFDPDGKFLLQIGGRGPSKGSRDVTQLGGAAAVDVDPVANEVYIADGYGNHRVIVFDADTGRFKRQWGAYGDPPTDVADSAYDPQAAPARQFHIAHGIRLSRDGLVYVSDRLNDRVQIFKKDGTFVAERFYERNTRGSGSVGNVSFWPDAQQTYALLNDPGNFQWVLTRRSDGEVLSRFGHYGTYGGEFTRNHQMEFDRHGAIYTSEDFRVQRFRIVNGVRPR